MCNFLHETYTRKPCFVIFTEPIVAENVVFVPGNNIKLLCEAHSDLAQLHWRRSGQILRPDDKHYFSDWGLLIIGASPSDAGLYYCDSVEKTTGRVHNKTVASYQLQLSSVGATNDGELRLLANYQSDIVMMILKVSVILLSLTCFCLTAVIVWKWNKERLRSVKFAHCTSQSQRKRQSKYLHEQIFKPMALRSVSAIDESASYLKGNGGPTSTQKPSISVQHEPGHIIESEI